MANTDQIHSFIRLVMNENLAQAQSVIQEALNTKLSEALDEKFEAYAPAIFEELDPSEEEGDEGDEGDEEDDMSDQQLQSDENYQDLPSDEKAAMKRDRRYPSSAGSDGY